MSSSTSVPHFAPFASLSTGSVGLRPSWLTSSQTSSSHEQQHSQQQSQPSLESHPQRQQLSQDSSSQQQQRPLSHTTQGLDALAEGSQFALNQLQLSRMQESSTLPSTGDTAKKDFLYSSEHQSSVSGTQTTARKDPGAESRSTSKRAASSAPIRRRISRACDQCNQLRTKCDGQAPCAHCIEFGLTCEYARERKKRGKASKKDLAAQAAAAAAAAAATAANSGATTSQGLDKQATREAFDSPFGQSRQLADPTKPPHLQQPPSIPSLTSTSTQQQQLRPGMDNVTLSHFSQLPDMNRSGLQVGDLRSLHSIHNGQATTQTSPSVLAPQPFSNYHDPQFPLINSHDHNPTSLNGFRFSNSGDNNSVPFLGLTPPAQTPAWLSLPSPPPATFATFSTLPTTNTLRYPVLQPLLPHITAIIPQSLACDLLELYFASSSSIHLCPQSPYVVGYFFRKQSILHPTRPRTCSPALLASMLWVAAQTSDAAFLTSPPSARGRVCQKLLELTIGLLKPLVHGPAPGETSPNYAANMVINGVALGGFGVSMDQLGAESSATGAIDDVATYIHLATVVSASEYKAASIRWWSAAWSLARELKLGRELPPDPSQPGADGIPGTDHDGDTEMGRHAHIPGHTSDANVTASATISEEEREERRRIWWLLYTMDRHLALCYNRPLILLDKECEGLYQPMNDALWQAGDFAAAKNNRYRRMGPPLECTDHSMFGYFLPLMTILGGIVDLQMARNHPRFGMSFRNSNNFDAHVAEIKRQLGIYEQSLRDFEARHTVAANAGINADEPIAADNQLQDVVSPSGRSSSTVASRMSESIVQTKIVAAYGTHIMHVLHILLTGKWDPISLLDDNDLWISSESFIQAMGHAVKAAEAAEAILEYDPDLSFMPFFFGMYLLQGSFLLLLTADKLQGDASPSVVRACETIVRAHEACVVTLNTEYQRNFRKVMRSALAQVRGRVPDDFGEQQQRRREVLALYRWTGDGTGLAL